MYSCHQAALELFQISALLWRLRDHRANMEFSIEHLCCAPSSLRIMAQLQHHGEKRHFRQLRKSLIELHCPSEKLICD